MLTALVLLPSCVDEKIEGESTRLLLLDVQTSTTLKPGVEVSVALQAVDDEGAGVPDQQLELVVTDASRLTFAERGGDRLVVSTEQKISANGFQIVGGVVVELEVPAAAPSGAVTLVASLEGRRGSDLKTRFRSFSIVSSDAPPPIEDAGSTDAAPDADPTPPAPQDASPPLVVDASDGGQGS